MTPHHYFHYARVVIAFLLLMILYTYGFSAHTHVIVRTYLWCSLLWMIINAFFAWRYMERGMPEGRWYSDAECMDFE